MYNAGMSANPDAERQARLDLMFKQRQCAFHKFNGEGMSGRTSGELGPCAYPNCPVTGVVWSSSPTGIDLSVAGGRCEHQRLNDKFS